MLLRRDEQTDRLTINCCPLLKTQVHTGTPSPATHRPLSPPRMHCALAEATERHRNNSTPFRDKHTPVTHTQSHEHRTLQSPSYGWDTGPGATATQVSWTVSQIPQRLRTQGTHGGRSLGTYNQRRSSGSVRALRQQELVPPPHTGASPMGSQLGTLPQHPKPQLGVTVRHYCLRRRPVSRWAASRQPPHTPGSGPHVPLLRTVLGLCCGCLPLQGWRLGLAGHCCRLCLLPGGLRPGPWAHPPWCAAGENWVCSAPRSGFRSGVTGNRQDQVKEIRRE